MIVSRGNETLKAIRRLRRRQDDERILLEGPHLLEMALDAGLELESVLLSPEFEATDAAAKLLPRLPRTPLRVRADLLGEIADADAPKGLLAVARAPRRGLGDLPVDPKGLYLYLDGIQDPGNLGAIARVASAFTATGLALGSGCADSLHPRALRGSAGTLLRLPVAAVADPEALNRHLAGVDGVLWAILDAHGGAPLPERQPPGPLVLVLGAEGCGVTAAIQDRADLRWTIPLAPGVESLNVAVAAGIALYALRAAAVP